MFYDPKFDYAIKSLYCFIFFSTFLLAVRQSRKSILLELDGEVQPAGSLLALENFNYNYLVTECLGSDRPDGNF